MINFLKKIFQLFFKKENNHNNVVIIKDINQPIDYTIIGYNDHKNELED